MTVAIPLPNGKNQFCDANGKPLAGGYVYTYTPGTSTPKATYQDINATTTNANPIVLDASGECVIFGTGAYRQVVFDSLGNQIWDQNTQVATLALLGGLSSAGDTATGRMTFPSVTINGSTGTTITPVGNPALLAVNNVSGAAQSTTQNEILFAANYTSNVGQGASVPASKNKVAGYFGMEADSGSGNAWALNTVFVLGAGAGANGGMQGAEFDFANNSGTHFGDADGVTGVVQPAAFGMQVTGISTNRATAAIAVLGNLADLTSPMWNRGLAFANNSCKLVTIADYTDSATSIDIRGTHANYGVDFQNGTCTNGVIRLGNTQKIVARNAANNADYTVLTTTVGDNVSLGSASTPYVLSAANLGLAPNADNTQTCGQAAARWSAVWAANGTVQTSDPSLKTDMTPIRAHEAQAVLSALEPIRFKWKDGGGGLPGKRQHWGWNAENVKAAFDGIEQDFGGYVEAEDHTKHLRPDQLIPVLAAALKDAMRRIAALEARP